MLLQVQIDSLFVEGQGSPRVCYLRPLVVVVFPAVLAVDLQPGCSRHSELGSGDGIRGGSSETLWPAPRRLIRDEIEVVYLQTEISVRTFFPIRYTRLSPPLVQPSVDR